MWTSTLSLEPWMSTPEHRPMNVDPWTSTPEHWPMNIDQWTSTHERRPVNINPWTVTNEHRPVNVNPWPSTNERLPVNIDQRTSTRERQPLNLDPWASTPEHRPLNVAQHRIHATALTLTVASLIASNRDVVLNCMRASSMPFIPLCISCRINASHIFDRSGQQTRQLNGTSSGMYASIWYISSEVKPCSFNF